jgi:hypothetical protein
VELQLLTHFSVDARTRESFREDDQCTCLGLSSRLDLDRSRARFEVPGKTGVSDFPNRLVRFW